jgi:hypothetical protein
MNRRALAMVILVFVLASVVALFMPKPDLTEEAEGAPKAHLDGVPTGGH